MVWLNAMMILVQLGQLAALLIVPPLAAVLAIATMLWAFWAFANFVAELHGFRNPSIVLGAVVLTTIVLFFGVAMLLAILGSRRRRCHDVRPRRRAQRLPDPRARSARAAAGLSRQRRVGAEAAAR